MKITRVICAKGRTGFYFDDQKAIKAGATLDGNYYAGEPSTPGFTAIRQAGESISIMLELADGQIAHGDAAAVQYSGAGGRDPLFLADDFIPVIEKYVVPELVGQEADDFLGLAGRIEALRQEDGKPLHTAIRYGVSQAILDAVAKSSKTLMCDVVAAAYDQAVSETRIPIFSQSGDRRHSNADLMIIKAAEVLPHALINNLATKLGKQGELLRDYIVWLRERIALIKQDESYLPVFHIDVYGTIGQFFGVDNIAAMASYLETLVEAAAPHQLRIEGPMDAGSKEAQIKALAALTAEVDRRGIAVELVADEWCNTKEDIVAFADAKAGHMIQIKTPDLGGVQNSAEAVLYCKEKGIGAYLGGTCNETDRSAQVCVHVAMATSPVQMLAKPGMGVDEGYMIVNNEMERILALRNARQ